MSTHIYRVTHNRVRVALDYVTHKIHSYHYIFFPFVFLVDQGGTGWQVLTGATGASGRGELGTGAMSVQTASLASNPWAVNGAYQGVSPQHRDMRPPQPVGGDGSVAGATPQPLDPMDYTLGGTSKLLRLSRHQYTRRMTRCLLFAVNAVPC